MKNNLKLIGWLLILIGWLLIGFGFLIDYNDLSKFKKCYDNSFKFKYCEKYINY